MHEHVKLQITGVRSVSFEILNEFDCYTFDKWVRDYYTALYPECKTQKYEQLIK